MNSPVHSLQVLAFKYIHLSGFMQFFLEGQLVGRSPHSALSIVHRTVTAFCHRLPQGLSMMFLRKFRFLGACSFYSLRAKKRDSGVLLESFHCCQVNCVSLWVFFPTSILRLKIPVSETNIHRTELRLKGSRHHQKKQLLPHRNRKCNLF